METMKFKDRVGGFVTDPATGLSVPLARPSGVFNVKVFGGHVVGKHYSGVRLLDEFEFPNLVVNTGRTYITGSALLGVTVDTTYFVGIISASPTIAAGDTMASHAGWTELTGYSQATRPAWSGVAGGTAGNANNSASPAVFSINAGSQTLGGAFISGDNTRGGTTGTLIAAGSITNTALANPSTLNITYDFSW